MFRQLALLLAPPPSPPSPAVAEQAARDVFSKHPIQLSRFLEEVWAGRNPNLTLLTPTGLEIPANVPQLGLERDSGIQASIPTSFGIAVTGTPTTSNFQLTVAVAGGTTATATLNFTANAADVETGLAALGTGNFTVTGGPLPTTPIVIAFQGAIDPRTVTITASSPNVVIDSKLAQYPPRLWDQLIYAYMVENTRVYEIFRRVLEEYAYGERLGVPSDESQRWLRATEQLFFNDNPPFQIYTLATWIRPDIRGVRRNAYHRLFGLDLNHGTDDNRPYPYPRAAAANTEFVATFEALLREVWRAIENVRNQVGANATDVTTIANLSRAIFDMLRVRRQENVGNLARDELWHVSTMAWFHLTLSFNTPIVLDLKSEATSAAERLQKIGERVGLPAHSRSDSYFRLATNMSLILREMELGTFNDPTNGAPALFQNGVFQAAMQETITHWSVATGRDVKQWAITVTPPPAAPVKPAPLPLGGMAPPSSNGHSTTQVPEPVPS
jgi:hypothetical protein